MGASEFRFLFTWRQKISPFFDCCWKAMQGQWLSQKNWYSGFRQDGRSIYHCWMQSTSGTDQSRYIWPNRTIQHGAQRHIPDLNQWIATLLLPNGPCSATIYVFKGNPKLCLKLTCLIVLIVEKTYVCTP